MTNFDDFLAEVHTVAIGGHIRPDGDCVGSCLATYNYIKTWYPDIDVTVYLEPIPNIFKFMARSNEIVSDFSGDTVYDLFIAQDCGDTGRLGGAARLLPVLVVGILVLCTFYQGVRIHRNDSGEGLKASQEQAAAVILANADALPIDDFWTNPEFSVLTGLPYHSDSRVNSSLLVYTSIRALTEHGRPDATIYTEMCGVVLFASTDVLVCTPTSRPE